MDRLLVLVRHGQSEWNLKNLFTGWRDVDLTDEGVAEAVRAGRSLKAQGLRFDVAFTSVLKRAQRTLDIMLDELGQENIPVLRDQALNERDYGDLVGLNKDDARKRWGDEQVLKWRRSYDIARPAARACATPPRGCCPTTSKKYCRGCCGASACWSPPTAIRCARSSWCSTATRPNRSSSSTSTPACR